MKFEGGSLKCEIGAGVEVSSFTFHSSHFLMAIKRNFEELGI